MRVRVGVRYHFERGITALMGVDVLGDHNGILNRKLELLQDIDKLGHIYHLD